jgi:hypothetical protein
LWLLEGECAERIQITGQHLHDDRLVGLHPILEIVEAGLTPGAEWSPHTGNTRPKVLLSRLILRAGERARASAAEFSFCVDLALTKAFRIGDVVQLARTACGGVGLSVARGGELLAAVGAVTSVHTGAVSVRVPDDAVRDAKARFRQLDPEFDFPELPLEIRAGAERRVLYRGCPTMGDYTVFVEHGFRYGLPGFDECLALWRTRALPSVIAISSAQLLEYSDLMNTVYW